MKASDRKRIKEEIDMFKEVIICALLVGALVTSCEGKRERTAILNDIATLRAVVEKTQTAVETISEK